MLASIIAKLGVPLLVSVIAGALGRVDNPIAKNTADALNNFETAMAGASSLPNNWPRRTAMPKKWPN